MTEGSPLRDGSQESHTLLLRQKTSLTPRVLKRQRRSCTRVGGPETSVGTETTGSMGGPDHYNHSFPLGTVPVVQGDRKTPLCEIRVIEIPLLRSRHFNFYELEQKFIEETNYS